jgi:hypothetical protein
MDELAYEALYFIFLAAVYFIYLEISKHKQTFYARINNISSYEKNLSLLNKAFAIYII